MLSVFPALLFLSPFAALLIRLTLAGVFAYSAWTRSRDTRTFIKVFGTIDALFALMLLVGAYTQLAALGAMLCSIVWLIRSDWSPLPRSTTHLVIVLAVSALVLGAGPFAFDLPL